MPAKRDLGAPPAELGEIPDEIVLSSGVHLKVKAVPPFLVRSVALRVPKPTPPLVDVGGRMEENPDHPKYIADMEEYEQKMSEKAMDVLIIAGTELVSVPEGFSAPEDEEWVSAVEEFGVEIDKSPKGRYLAWVRLHALASGDDIALLNLAVGAKSGISEEEVQQAVASFWGGKVRGADNGSPPETPGDGDNL